MCFKLLAIIVVTLTVLLFLGEICPTVANPIQKQKNIKVKDDGTTIEIGLEFEMNLEIKLNGNPDSDSDSDSDPGKLLTEKSL